MATTIKKDDDKKPTIAAIKRLEKKTQKNAGIADFYGKLQGQLGDGLEIQKNSRNEWD